ncbi:MAG: extracellular solute-binding protein [Chloroflexi bacterium]|nr:extracellular solute-binding protein [Chloroflexota bacterium]
MTVIEPQRGRLVSELTREYLSGRITRRAFMGRLMALGVSASAAASLLASRPVAAQSSESSLPSDVTGEIRFLLGPFTEDEMDVQRAIAAKFNERYPNVTFTFRLFDWATSRTEVQLSLTEGAHDIYTLGEGDIVFYSADDSALLDLAPFVDDPGFADDRAQITGIERILGMSPYPVAVPYLWFPENALYVNMDKLRAAGFDGSFVDGWDTFRDAAIGMTNPSTGEFGVGLNLHNYVEWYGRLRSAGTDWLTPDLSAPAVNTPNAIQATQDMVDLFLTHQASPPLGQYDYTTGIDAFAGGRLGMVGYDASVAGTLKRREVPFEWEVRAWPPGPGGRATVLNTMSLGIGKKTPNPELAWEVLRFWTSPEIIGPYAGNAGYYPSHEGAFGPEYEALIPAQMLTALEELTTYGVFMMAIPQGPDINFGTTPQIERAYAGEVSSTEAIQNAETVINQIMEF